jgi:uncharacterized cupredoxin-like copper-binding protein
VLVLALSTGHKVGLAVVGAAFIVFALASSFLFPRIRPQFPGRGLPAFIVVTVVFFIGMLTAVEVFGAEKKEKTAAGTSSQASTSQTQPTTTTTASTSATTSTAKSTTTASPSPPPAAPQTVAVTETEFKITLAQATLHAGPVTFQIKNAGKIPHDLAITGGPKSSLISPGKSATLTATLKKGPLELYCSVPGHKQAGMDLKLPVS